MPVYEYDCRVCGHRFEVLQKVGEDGKSLKCPKCDSDEPTRVFSVFSGGKPSGKSSLACPSKGFS